MNGGEAGGAVRCGAAAERDEDRFDVKCECTYRGYHDQMVRVCAVASGWWACADLGALRPSLSKESLISPPKLFFKNSPPKL